MSGSLISGSPQESTVLSIMSSMSAVLRWASSIAPGFGDGTDRSLSPWMSTDDVDRVCELLSGAVKAGVVSGSGA